MKPALIVHCDWSIDARKRWLAAAALLPGGQYEAAKPTPVGWTGSFFPNLRERAPTGPILAGFDFPIGVPRLYAERAGIASFRELLPSLGQGRWVEFYRPAETRDQISISRPFYPRAPGGSKKQHLVDGLGLRSADELLRLCDRSTPSRNKACEIFWTLGANQVGRAAIAGWRDLLAPGVREGAIAIWPFDGDVPALLDNGRVVVLETYPAETYGHIGLDRGFGKRRQDGRKSQASAILAWCERNCVCVRPELVADIEAGFGESAMAEDAFDSVIGLLGIIEVVQDVPRFAIPTDPAVRSVEGWILGLGVGVKESTSESLVQRVSERHPARPLVPSPALPDSSPAGPHSRLCPACHQKLFARWPWGWDAHAAHGCLGVQGRTPDERKRAYKERYLA